jgi:hypothetical protein
VPVALVIQHAVSMLRTLFISVVSFAVPLSHKWHEFSGNNNWTQNVFGFFLQRLSKIILILRRIGRDIINGPDWWPHVLRRGSAATRLLGLRVRISPGHGCFSCECVCCVQVSASCWSLVQRSPTECGVSEYDREASTMSRLLIREKNVRNIYRLSCKVPSTIVRFYWKLNFSGQIFRKILQ